MTLPRTLDEKIGQLLFCGWQGETEAEHRRAGRHARALVEELRVGGLIVMGRNIGDPEQVARVVGELQECAETPLWIGVDQEGGAVARFALPGLTFPGNMALGATGRPDLARAAARAIGEQLAAMGVNLDFAPVLDVNNNPANPVIGSRSFGEDPILVAEMGVAALEGFRGAGVVAVGKHFPGHGDTDVDSHLDLPVQPTDRERLEEIELVPFRAAIEAGIPALMTSHILFRLLDPERPATLSRPILTRLLREELGFDGVIVTDCMEMEGIAARWGPEEAAVMAIEAGADLLLVCHTWETQRRMAAALRQAVEGGRIAESRIDASVERILALKEQAGLADWAARRPPAPALVSGEKYRELEWNVSRAALTVVNDAGLLPIEAGEEVVLISGSPATAELAGQLRERGVLPHYLEDDPTAGEDPGIMLIERRAALVTGESESGAGARTIVIALRAPYALAHFPRAGCRIAAYSARPCAIAALADLLVGRAPAAGALPVTLPE